MNCDPYWSCINTLCRNFGQGVFLPVVLRISNPGRLSNLLKIIEIPLVGRIVTVADVFDALTTERPYKKAWSLFDTLGFIQKKSGEIFDPGLVRIFMKILPQILGIKEQYQEAMSVE